MAVKDGGPAVSCRTCGEGFMQKPWQVAKSDRECPKCKRSRQNAKNATRDLSAYAKTRYQQIRDKVAAYHKEKRQSDPMYVVKRRARRLLAYAIEKGRIVRGPCQRCGAKRVDGHHHDYSKPLDVTWLCRRCHFAVERSAA